MTFLPIVARELRVASRRRGTYWTRVITAGLGLLIFAGVMIIAELSRGTMGGQIGVVLFHIFSWLAFIFAVTAGIFFTSDCLSEEKREGTFGLLFLTDLRGYDVVLGKLLASSLRGAYGLLAAFPVIGLSFLLGGVTGEAFARLILVLLNSLFFSLAAGMFVSALSRDTQRAMNGTLLLCLTMVVLLPLADWLLARWFELSVPFLWLASPSYGFVKLQMLRSADFWTTTALVHGLGWLFLSLSCALAPRHWQDKPAPAASFAGETRWRIGSRELRRAWRERLFAINPVRWLAARNPWMARFVLLTVLALLAIFGAVALAINNAPATTMIGYPAMWLFSLLFIIWVASQASRFFVDAARTGVLELLLATPLPARLIVAGQWWSLMRSFLAPAMLLLAFRAGLGLLQILQFAQVTTTGAAGTGRSINFEMLVHQLITHGFAVLNFVTGLLAIAWVGMWMGLTTRKPNTAVIKTVAFVGVLPWIALLFVQGVLYALISFTAARAGMTLFWIPPAVAGTLALAVNVVFFIVARRKLSDLRTTFARASGAGVRRESQAFIPPPLPVPAAP